MLTIYSDGSYFKNGPLIGFLTLYGSKINSDKCLILSNFCKPLSLAVQASKEINEYYPFESLQLLSNRIRLFHILHKDHGFLLTGTHTIYSFDEIDFAPFIIKPVFSSHFTNLQTNKREEFCFKIFNSPEELLQIIDKCSLNKILETSYFIVQQAPSTNSPLIRFSGVTNSDSEICFHRTSFSKIDLSLSQSSNYLNKNQVFCIRSYRDQKYQETKILIKKLIKNLNIRCAPFTFEFVIIDNELKPIDWSFNFSPFYDRAISELDINEYYHHINFMFNIVDTDYSSDKDILVYPNKVEFSNAR